jgi:sec-independent protein translocase protein TatA
MLRGLEGWHFIVLAAVVAVLFGYKRMPDAARSMGRSMRIFKSEVETMRKDDKPEVAASIPVPTPTAAPAPAAAATPTAATVPAPAPASDHIS